MGEYALLGWVTVGPGTVIVRGGMGMKRVEVLGLVQQSALRTSDAESNLHSRAGHGEGCARRCQGRARCGRDFCLGAALVSDLLQDLWWITYIVTSPPVTVSVLDAVRFVAWIVVFDAYKVDPGPGTVSTLSRVSMVPLQLSRPRTRSLRRREEFQSRCCEWSVSFHRRRSSTGLTR